MRKGYKKCIILSLTILGLSNTGGIAFAATYGDSSNGVRNTGQFQVRYVGEAWTNRRGNSTWIKYYRNGSYLGGAMAYKDSWRTDNGKVYDSVTIWDSMNPWAPKTTFHYKL